VCDECHAKHFAALETARWRRAFEEAQSASSLGPSEIRNIRSELQLPMEQFAFLIGCTRQSIHNWERPKRKSAQSRMADLLLKLVRKSYREGPVEVVSFLIDQARQQGVPIAPNPLQAIGWRPLLLRTQRAPTQDQDQQSLPLAADTEGGLGVVLVDAAAENRVGTLSYDFASASLIVQFSAPVEFDYFDVKVRFSDGSVEQSRSVHVVDGRAVILETQRSEEDVESLRISPPGDVKAGAP
jgi:DNA-binding transcriptional regulator YiaG